ncbi:MAG: protein-L-isoaspartate(D-aspartate) O-methyltransferase [Actinomycetota bacterium]|nr:protein-L-isoaspartate(D-aspartate) O-methyltransferase [Actinomycetota bacterium]
MSTDRVTALRYALVDTLRSNGALQSASVAAALLTVPRERFVPAGTPPEDAYADRALVLTYDEAGRPTSSISQPSMVALMLEQLDVHPGQRVLEIGTASGYNAALLAHLSGPAGAVTTIEFDTELAASASQRLAGFDPPVLVRVGDGWLGAPDLAPFDRIEVTVGVDDLSPAWMAQLREEGMIVAPLTLRPGLELSIAWVRSGDELRSTSVQPCGFVRMRGPHAGSSGYLPLDNGAVLLADWIAGSDPERLRMLLRDDPVDAGPTGPLPDGWLVPLTLHASYPLVLVTREPTLAGRPGLYDPDGGGVAIVDGDRVACYGDLAAARLLREHLASVRPVRETALRFVARPAAAPPPPGCWTVRKPHFTYAVDPQ